jgi:hypothetical protein
LKFPKTLVSLVVFAFAFATQAVAQISWTNESPSGIADDIWCATYANGTFAAVTNQGRLLTSTDALTWSSQFIAQGTWLVSIAYGNGMWVVVGDKGTILLSTDLKTWVNATSATATKLNGVCYTGSIWIAVGEAGTILTSPNAQTWTLQPPIPGITGFLHGIASVPASAVTSGRNPSNGLILVSGENGVLLQLAPDGTPSFGVGNFSGTNGITENLEAIIVPANAPNGAVSVGAGGTIARLSFFETNFNVYGVTTVTPSVVLRGLTFGNGFYVAAGEQGTIFTSPDALSWTRRFSGDSPSTVSTATLLGAAYSPTLQRFVVVGTAGTVLVSNSPPTVFGNVSTRGYVSPTETFIGGFVIQGTAPRTVLIRGDGPVLSTFSVPSPLPDPVVTVYNSSGAVVAINTGWGTNTNPAAVSTAALEVGAFALPSASADSALLLTLPPGAYTVQITSAKGNSGIALFEAYTD